MTPKQAERLAIAAAARLHAEFNPKPKKKPTKRKSRKGNRR